MKTNTQDDIVLKALRKLNSPDIEKRQIYVESINQWKEHKAFSPKMLNALIIAFVENNIDYKTMPIKVRFWLDRHYDDIEDFVEWQYLQMRDFLSKNLQLKYDKYFNVKST